VSSALCWPVTRRGLGRTIREPVAPFLISGGSQLTVDVLIADEPPPRKVPFPVGVGDEHGRSSDSLGGTDPGREMDIAPGVAAGRR